MQVQIIGAGLAGLSAAITLAKKGIHCNLISVQPSERATSVLAAGGINGALNTAGEQDSWEQHSADTKKAGVNLADPEAIDEMTQAAPDLIRWLYALGVPFNEENGRIMQRNFGGQKKKRTAYAKSSTGKILMQALIDEVRKYEMQGLIQRYPHHAFCRLLKKSDGSCAGVVIEDVYQRQRVQPGEKITRLQLEGPVIVACGGMHGLFPKNTTGSVANTAEVAASLFSSGVRFSNLEMLQYHPTTFRIAGKCCLVSEAARGEGGRLYILRDGKPWYFMEELYPELGNLMPRDVVSREMYRVLHEDNCGDQVYLDMTGLSKEIWVKRLSDLREEILHYLHIDPAKKPIPVDPAIHYFMGGIDVDKNHKTNLSGLYAAGECCSQYHGANRLGGNSLLGAIYGGRKAAESAAMNPELADMVMKDNVIDDDKNTNESVRTIEENCEPKCSSSVEKTVGDILIRSMGIVRNEKQLEAGLQELRQLEKQQRVLLAEAMIRSAQFRKESRGAHFREDYPERDDALASLTQVIYDGEIRVSYKDR